jgi:hypothetical protein
MTVVLGCDVGAHTGLAVLNVGPFVSCLHRVTVTPGEVTLTLREILGQWPINVVGIETPSQVFAHGRAKGDMGARIGIERALLAARDVAGVIRGTIEALKPGTPVYDGQAHEVRKIVGKMKRGSQDKCVAAFVRASVRDWPKGKGDNDHNRDAAVAALWAGRRALMGDALPVQKAPRRARRST